MASLWILGAVLYLAATATPALSQLGPSPPPPPCPPSCDCSTGPAFVECRGDPDINLISFDGFGIESVPIFSGFYPRLSTLDLQHNDIRVIRSQELSFTALPELKTVILSDNRINVLEDDAFQLPSLEILDLSDNRLEVFHTRSIRSTTDDFVQLLLRNNGLRRIEDSFRLTATRYPNLRISLEGNNIDCIESEDFFPSICAFIADNATCFDTYLGESLMLQILCGNAFITEYPLFNSEPFPFFTDYPATNSVTDDSTAIIVGVVVGGALGIGLLAFLVVVAVVFCCKLKKWERKIDNATGYRNDTLSQQLNNCRQSMAQPSMSLPRYVQQPTNDLPHPAFLPPPCYQYPPVPPPCHQYPPVPPPYTTTTTTKPGGKEATGDTDTLYEDVENFGRPLPEAPSEDMDYESGYILRVDSIPTRQPPKQVKLAAEIEMPTTEEVDEDCTVGEGEENNTADITAVACMEMKSGSAENEESKEFQKEIEDDMYLEVTL